MAYAERIDGKLTGKWVARVRRKRCGVCFKRAFASKHAAESGHDRSP